MAIKFAPAAELFKRLQYKLIAEWADVKQGVLFHQWMVAVSLVVDCATKSVQPTYSRVLLMGSLQLLLSVPEASHWQLFSKQDMWNDTRSCMPTLSSMAAKYFSTVRETHAGHT